MIPVIMLRSFINAVSIGVTLDSLYGVMKMYKIAKEHSIEENKKHEILMKRMAEVDAEINDYRECKIAEVNQKWEKEHELARDFIKMERDELYSFIEKQYGKYTADVLRIHDGCLEINSQLKDL